MNTTRWLELMNKELDGANSPEESAALRSHLAASEDARRQFDELSRMARLLGDAGEVQPPAAMEARIMDAIDARDAAGRERGFFLDFLSPRRKIAYSFAAGIVIGIALFVIAYFALNHGTGLDVRDLYGSIAERGRPEAAMNWRSVEISGTGCDGTAAIRYDEEAMFVKLAIDAVGPVEVNIEPGAGLPLHGFQAPACGPYALSASGMGVSVTLDGRCEFVAVFADANRERPPLRLSVKRGGRVLYERTMEIGRE